MSGSTFSQSIILDGGDKVAEQLANIGQAGQQAFQQAQTGAQQASAGFGELKSAVEGFFSGFKQFAKSADDDFGKFVSDIGSAFSELKNFGAGISGIVVAAAAVSSAIGVMGQSAADSISKLNDAAEAAGLTLEKYRGIVAGAAGIGVKESEITSIFDHIDKVSRQAASIPYLGFTRDEAGDLKEIIDPETKKYREAVEDFKKIGVTLSTGWGKSRSQNDIFEDTIKALEKVKNKTKQTELAIKAFGDAIGKNVIQLVESREEFEKVAAAVAASGVGLSDDQKDIIKQARETGSALSVVTESWWDYIKALAAPVALDRNNATLKFLEDNKTAIKDFLDNYIGPALRWLGELKNSLGAVSVAVGVLGLSFGAIGPITAAALGIAGGAFIFYWDDVKKYSAQGMAEIKRIMSQNDLHTWDGWKNAAREVWADVTAIVSAAYEKIKAATLAAFPGLTSVWTAVEKAVTSAWTYIKEQSAQGFPGLRDGWESIKSAALFAWDIIKTGAILAWGAIKKIKEVADEAAAVINTMFGTNFTGATLLATVLFAKLASSLIEVPGWLKVIALLLSPLAAAFAYVTAAIRGSVAAIDWVLGKFNDLLNLIEGAIIGALRKLAGEEIWNGMKAAAKDVLDFISSALDKVAAAAKAAWAAISGGSSGSASSDAPSSSRPSPSSDGSSIVRSWTPGHASGGLLSGPGTGTSDSILARVSNKEYIVNAERTEKLGVGFMNFLNFGDLSKVGEFFSGLTMPKFASGGSVDDSFRVSGFKTSGFWSKDEDASSGGPTPSDALFLAYDKLMSMGRVAEAARVRLAAYSGNYLVNGVKAFASGGLAIPGFAAGGFVNAPGPMTPAFAGGGSVGGQRAGLVSFPMDLFGQQFDMMAPKDQVKDLQRHSTSLQMASTNRRKPSWDR